MKTINFILVIIIQYIIPILTALRLSVVYKNETDFEMIKLVVISWGVFAIICGVIGLIIVHFSKLPKFDKSKINKVKIPKEIKRIPNVLTGYNNKDLLNELIKKWENEFNHYDELLKQDKSETIEQLYRCSFETRQIKCFIDDLKKLS